MLRERNPHQWNLPMQIPPMRPTFKINFPVNPDTAIDLLSQLLSDDDFPITGRIAGSHMMLVIPPDRRHFWSPWLHLEVEQISDDNSVSQSTVRGRFSPNPSVWTGFMLTYIALASMIFFAIMFGIAQWMMNNPLSSLKLIPVFGIIAGVMYCSSLIGQRIAQEQMHELYQASMNALNPKAT